MGLEEKSTKRTSRLMYELLHERKRKQRTIFSSVGLSEDVEGQLTVLRVQVEEDGVESSVELSRDGLLVGGVSRRILDVGIASSDW